MSLLEPLTGGDQYQPVYTQLPSAQRSLLNKYNRPEVIDAFTQLQDAPMRQAIIDMDLNRVQQGQSPLPVAATVKAAQGLATNTEATPAPKKSPWSVGQFAKNTVGDAAAILHNIPNIIPQAVHEFTAASKLSEELPKAKNFTDITRLPGIRLLPGAYTLGNIAGGKKGLAEAASHPLMTGLDVAPFAKAKLFAPEAKAAELAAETGTTAAKRSLMDVAMSTRPGQTARTLGSVGKDIVSETKPGQFAAQAFGPQARQSSAIVFGKAKPQIDAYMADLLEHGMDDQTARAVFDQAQQTFRGVGDMPANEGLAELQRRVATQTSSDLADLGGTSRDAVMAEAQRWADHTGRAPEIYIDRKYIDPVASKKYSGPLFDAFRERDMLVPKNLAVNMNRFATPTKNMVQSALDPITGVFRTAVLPFSARYHLNNIVGGGVLVGAERPTAFLQMGRAFDSVFRKKNITLAGEELTPEAVRQMIGGKGQQAHFFNELDAEAGRSISDLTGRLMARAEENPQLAEQLQHFTNRSPLPSAFGTATKTATRAKGLIGKAAEKSFDFGAMFDDFWRTTAAFDELGKAMKGGKNLGEAQALATDFTRKVLPNWVEMTPLERTIVRSVFPFYSFQSFITRYVMRFAADHPWRVAVLDAFARAEQADRQSGLPDQFRDYILYGKTDEKGNRKAFTPGAMNPFRDASNLFTLAGFTSGLNPVGQAALKAMGVDTRTASPDTYMDLEYDPATGKLVYKKPSFLGGLLESTIPQVAGVKQFFGQDEDFNRLATTNPEAAQRLMRSSAGLPNLFRTVNPTQERVKTEVTRQEAQRTALRNALKSGNDAEAMQYPQLRPLLIQVRQLQSQGGLTGYESPANSPAALQQAQSALIGTFRP